MKMAKLAAMATLMACSVPWSETVMREGSNSPDSYMLKDAPSAEEEREAAAGRPSPSLSRSRLPCIGRSSGEWDSQRGRCWRCRPSGHPPPCRTSRWPLAAACSAPRVPSAALPRALSSGCAARGTAFASILPLGGTIEARGNRGNTTGETAPDRKRTPEPSPLVGAGTAGAILGISSWRERASERRVSRMPLGRRGAATRQPALPPAE
mmetsp:Transcript_30440/g.78195  ORF Transcript_30440/g.78195 Transcript_30440/m.78195 type:complete len:209 (-) Transcript_30440:162-788(-)